MAENKLLRHLNQMRKNILFLAFHTLLISCGNAKDTLDDIIGSSSGNYWDLVEIYSQNSSEKLSHKQGICFYSNHKCYAYSYSGGKRIPYMQGLRDISSPEGIANNLRPYCISADSILAVDRPKGKIYFLNSDTMKIIDHKNNFKYTFAKAL